MNLMFYFGYISLYLSFFIILNFNIRVYRCLLYGSKFETKTKGALLWDKNFNTV